MRVIKGEILFLLYKNLYIFLFIGSIKFHYKGLLFEVGWADKNDIW